MKIYLIPARRLINHSGRMIVLISYNATCGARFPELLACRKKVSSLAIVLYTLNYRPVQSTSGCVRAIIKPSRISSHTLRVLSRVCVYVCMYKCVCVLCV